MVERTEEEKAIGRVIWEGPAFLVNRAWIVWNGQMIRITFGEQGGPDEPPLFRAAVGMTPADATAFAQVLADTLKQLQEAIARQPAVDK
jgi:hypothetical protein